MTSYIKYPIRMKLLLLMSSFVLLATLAYLVLALKVFKDDKVQLIYELNVSTVKTLSAQIEASLLKTMDKVKLLTQGYQDPKWVKSVFESEPDLIAYSLFSPTEGKKDWIPNVSVRNEDYLKVYNLKTSEIDRIREKLPIPFDEVIKKGIWIKNSTLPQGAPILTVAMSMMMVDDHGSAGKRIAVADLKMDAFLSAVSKQRLATIYIIDSNGSTIAHPDISSVTSRKDMKDIPIVSQALESPVTVQLKQFDWEGTRWLGAFSRTKVGGLIVISQVPESQAFRASQQLLQKSFLFSLIVLTAALLVSGWLARSLTEPIRKLWEATEKLARWEFGSSIHVKTQDEIASLARAFNAMASDLQNQRRQLDTHQLELQLRVKQRTLALELEKRKLSESQDALLRTTRLASLGELAGAAAHEVLNPINNMNIRVERIHQQLQGPEKNDIELLNTIISSWKESFTRGGWSALQGELMKSSQSSDPNGEKKTLVQEDLENLIGISLDSKKRMEDRVDDMRFLAKEIIRVTRIINSMRALSRVGGERRPLDIHSPLDETALTLGDIFQKRKIALVKDFSAEPREKFAVVGDKDELVQVFSNLIRNAMQAVTSAKRRAGEVRITTTRSGDRVEVRLTDNGTGISQENLSKLFETNFTTKSMEEGTGLGLSISRRLVRAFGGDIEVEKTIEGKGSTFLIWFPAATS